MSTHKDAPCQEIHRVNIKAGRTLGIVAGVVIERGEETWTPYDVFKIMCNETVTPEGIEHRRTVESTNGTITDATRTPDFAYAAAGLQAQMPQKCHDLSLQLP